MNEALFAALNSWVGTFPLFDEVLLHLTSNPLFKGMPPLMILWWLWGIRDNRTEARQFELLNGLIAVTIAVLLCRVLVSVGPYIPRPIHNPDWVVVLSPHIYPATLAGENGFPSDHATLLAALATVLLRQSRSWGWVALLHALTFGMISRVYFGFHAPLDVLAGALLGAGVVLGLTPFSRHLLLRIHLPTLMHRYPQLVLAGLFALSLQMSTIFTSARYFLDALGTAVTRITG